VARARDVGTLTRWSAGSQVRGQRHKALKDLESVLLWRNQLAKIAQGLEWITAEVEKPVEERDYAQMVHEVGARSAVATGPGA
jgi:hypothetical protein